MSQRFLALDWDQNQLHLVAASISGGSVRFHQAAVIDTDASPSPADAERLGKLLRERMKALGIGAAPVLACLGRDRVILKEVRFPSSVPAHEEPSVIRFQAVKELTDSADEVVIDYVSFPPTSPGGERRAQVMIARRAVVNTYQVLCESAGLKLVGLAPRSYGMAACLKRLLGSSVLVPAPEPPDAAVALVTVGEKWAEFCILKGEQLLQARTLELGPGLAALIRRNIAVHNGQQPSVPVQAVYLALSGEQASLREKLVESLDVPVHPFDPFAGAEGKELPASGRGTFAGAIGLLHLMAQRRQLPVNFVRVKQPRQPKDPNERLYVLAGALVVVLMLAGGVVGLSLKDDREKEVALKAQKLMDKTRELEQEREKRRVTQALHEWETVNWADELYDLADRMPRITRDFKVREMKGSPEKPAGKTNGPAARTAVQAGPPPVRDLNTQPAAKIALKIDSRDDRPLNQLSEELLREEQVKKDSYQTFYRLGAQSVNRYVYDKDYLIRKRPPDQYTRKMSVANP